MYSMYSSTYVRRNMGRECTAVKNRSWDWLNANLKPLPTRTFYIGLTSTALVWAGRERPHGLLLHTSRLSTSTLWPKRCCSVRTMQLNGWNGLVMLCNVL